jgi:hypothetical protein
MSTLALAQGDVDEDGIVDETCVCTPVDNCPGVYNPEQGDCDSDGVGDECDETAGCVDTDISMDTDTGTDVDEEDAGVIDPYIVENCIPMPHVFSPLTTEVEDHIFEIIEDGYEQEPNRFMVVGDSISKVGGLGSYFMGNCQYTYGEIENVWGWIGIKDIRCYPHLQNSLDFFLAGEIEPDVTSYTRKSMATYGGMTAKWAIKGDPEYGGLSPLEREIDAINPQYAIITFGSNDIYRVAPEEDERIQQIADNIMAIATECEFNGVVPIISSSINRLGYDDSMRILSNKLKSMCAGDEIPFINFFEATFSLEENGRRDSQHPRNNSYNRNCTFDKVALERGANMHNLITLEMLDRIFELVHN